MAWRIHDNVIRGELDNRQSGRVRGKLWLCGLTEPVVLDLQGNACQDLAGAFLTFENPGQPVPLPSDAHFSALQEGSIGDLTASRKVRVFDMPIEEAYMRKKKGLPVPEHMANCLYLEWFSTFNGRVVVESVDYKLKITPPTWRLTPQQEEERRHEAAQGFSGFMERLGAAVAAQQHEPSEEKEWDEFDYERFMRESDARNDKFGELLDKFRDHPDRDRIIAQEMGWTWMEEALDDEREGNAPGPWAAETQNEDKQTAEEELLEPPEAESLKLDPSTEGVDWVRGADGRVSHPLARRALEGSLQLWRKCKELGVRQMDDVALGELMSQYHIAAAKLAGALNGLAYGRHLRDGAFVVAYLKRGLHHLHAAQAALERVASRKKLPEETISWTRAELFGLREEILRLMGEFRGRT